MKVTLAHGRWCQARSAGKKGENQVKEEKSEKNKRERKKRGRRKKKRKKRRKSKRKEKQYTRIKWKIVFYYNDFQFTILYYI